MLNSNRFMQLTGLALTALVATNAGAASSANASLTGIRIVLTDLDTTDGISPSITFEENAGGSIALDPLSGYFQRPDPDPAFYDVSSVNGFTTPTSWGHTLGGMSGSAGVTLDGLTAVVSAQNGLASIDGAKTTVNAT